MFLCYILNQDDKDGYHRLLLEGILEHFILPAFACWVPFTLRKRDRTIAGVNSRVRKSSHKYGIKIPTSVKHAEEIDRKNKNTLWMDAISLEMTNVGAALISWNQGRTLLQDTPSQADTWCTT